MDMGIVSSSSSSAEATLLPEPTAGLSASSSSAHSSSAHSPAVIAGPALAKLSDSAQASILELFGVDGNKATDPPRHASSTAPTATNPKPEWTSLARNLMKSLKMTTAAETSQKYVTASGDERTERATMVQVVFGSEVPRSTYWHSGGTMLVTFTSALGKTKTETAVSVHILEPSHLVAPEPKHKIQPVLIAALSRSNNYGQNFMSYYSRAPGSFIVRTGDRMVVKAMNAEDGIYISKEKAKKLGPWHLELIVTACKVHTDPNFLLPQNEAEAKSFAANIKTCVRQGREGGIGGVPMLCMQCPVALWHPKCDGGSVDDVAVPFGKKRKKAKASGATGSAATGTPALLAVLKQLDVQLSANRVSTKVSKAAKEKASMAVARLGTQGECEGITFHNGTYVVPFEVWAIVLECLTDGPPKGKDSLRYSRYAPASALGNILSRVVPRVAKSWLASAQDPKLFTSLERLSSSMTMTALVQLLKQPKFALVERLAFRHKMKLGKTTSKALAAACPNLKHVDMGFADSKVHATGEILSELFVCAPHLESLSVDMWSLGSWELAGAVGKLGGKLKCLQVANEPITSHYMTDLVLRALSEKCPNLRSLYVTNSSYSYRAEYDRLTDAGVVAMLDGCNELECIQFHKSQNLTIKTLEALVGRLASEKLPKLHTVEFHGIKNMAESEENAAALAALKQRLNELVGPGFRCA